MSHTPDPAGPRPKTPIPPLELRAPRPPVVRLRKSLVAACVMGAAGLLAASLAWAFIVQPELRAGAHGSGVATGAPATGAVRPSERVTEGPATYADLDPLPEPRGFGAPAASSAREPGPAPQPRVSAAVPPRRLEAGAALAEARSSALFFSDRGVARTADSPAAGSRDRGYTAAYNTHELLAPLSPYEVKAGAVIPAALQTGIDTARPGPVTAVVTEDVYDTVAGRHLLIPQGARLLGRHEGESRHGDRRAFLTWERLMLPNGKSLALDREPGVDGQGRVGAPGRVDRRLLPLAAATLFAGAITTLGQLARDHDEGGGLLGDAGDAAAIQAAQTGGKLVERELDVRPSIRLRPGARVRVLITRDLVLEPYRP